QAEDGIRDRNVTGVQTCALPIYEYSAGEISPDGTRAIMNVATPWREGTNLSMAPAVMDMQSGQLQDLWPQLDRWVSPAWLTNTRSEERRVGKEGRARGEQRTRKK